jgi:hypothetical protein
MRRAAAALALVAAFACHSSVQPTPSVDSGTCASEGYLPATNGGCPKGTCLAMDVAVACCGSLCATCEDKGLISMTEAGTCPPGTMVAADLTATLQCCEGPDAESPEDDSGEDGPPVSDGGMDGTGSDAADASGG